MIRQVCIKTILKIDVKIAVRPIIPMALSYSSVTGPVIFEPLVLKWLTKFKCLHQVMAI